VPALTTQLSATADSINGVLSVTLNASNPTDTTVRVRYDANSVFAEVKLGGQWVAGSYNPGDGFGSGTDSLVLTPGAAATVGVVNVLFTPTRAQTNLTPSAIVDIESFAIAPGLYSVRACYFPVQPTGPVGGIQQSVCANGVSFTLTP
jgi:hypothetical protein